MLTFADKFRISSRWKLKASKMLHEFVKQPCPPSSEMEIPTSENKDFPEKMKNFKKILFKLYNCQG